MADILRKLAPLLDEEYLDMMAVNSAWNIVLGVMPYQFNGYENQIMEENRKDTTAEKIDNIDRITYISEYLLEIKPDFNYENLELFSQATCQLIRYTTGDPKAEDSLASFEDLYISFVTSYYIQNVKNGSASQAIKNINDIRNKVFSGEQEIAIRLENILLG